MRISDGYRSLILSTILLAFCIAASHTAGAVTCEEMQRNKDKNIGQCFIGTWNLVSNSKQEDGQLKFPFGEDAVGYLTYDTVGKMSAQMMAMGRNDQSQGYMAYFGGYEINTENETVTHKQTGNLDPKQVGTNRVRAYKFVGDRLHLVPLEDKTRTVIWEKITAP